MSGRNLLVGPLRSALVAAALIVLLAPILLLLKGPLANAADLDADAHPQPLAAQPCHRALPAPAHYQHVIWIWMENHSYHQVIGSEDAPFENQLAHACGLATGYRAIGHPSLPNYLAATGGSTFGVSKDQYPSLEPINAATIFSELAASGRQWRTYVESMPGSCHPVGKFGYARNPAAYFTGSREQCARWDVPMGTVDHGSLATALARNHLPAFSLMVPNMCHSTHACPVARGDTWLSRWINRIITSPAYQDQHTVVFLTWDEGKHDVGQHVPLLVISPTTTPGTTSRTPYNHYSLLRTTADLLGIAPPGHAITAPTMQPTFGL